MCGANFKSICRCAGLVAIPLLSKSDFLQRETHFKSRNYEPYGTVNTQTTINYADFPQGNQNLSLLDTKCSQRDYCIWKKNILQCTKNVVIALENDVIIVFIIKNMCNNLLLCIKLRAYHTFMEPGKHLR